MLEMGPGHSLSSYARRQEVKPLAAIPVLRHPNQEVDDTAAVLLAAGRAWAVGIDLDVARFAGLNRRLLRLPGYPFRREHHWIEPGEGRVAAATAPARSAAAASPEARRVTNLTDAFWAPTWSEQARTAPSTKPAGSWLVVAPSGDALATELVRVLTSRGAEAELTTTLDEAALVGKRSIVFVGPTADFDAATERWMTQASSAARALGSIDDAPTLLAAVTRGATKAGGRTTAPLDAMALGIVRTAPREYQGMRSVLVDLDPERVTPAELAADATAIVTELLEGSDQVVALRDRRRLVPHIERKRVGPVPDGVITFRHGGRYVVTGGVGDVGFALASSLIKSHGADIAVITSQPVPDGPEPWGVACDAQSR